MKEIKDLMILLFQGVHMCKGREDESLGTKRLSAQADMARAHDKVGLCGHLPKRLIPCLQ